MKTLLTLSFCFVALTVLAPMTVFAPPPPPVIGNLYDTNSTDIVNGYVKTNATAQATAATNTIQGGAVVGNINGSSTNSITNIVAGVNMSNVVFTANAGGSYSVTINGISSSQFLTLLGNAGIIGNSTTGGAATAYTATNMPNQNPIQNAGTNNEVRAWQFNGGVTNGATETWVSGGATNMVENTSSNLHFQVIIGLVTNDIYFGTTNIANRAISVRMMGIELLGIRTNGASSFTNSLSLTNGANGLNFDGLGNLKTTGQLTLIPGSHTTGFNINGSVWGQDNTDDIGLGGGTHRWKNGYFGGYLTNDAGALANTLSIDFTHGGLNSGGTNFTYTMGATGFTNTSGRTIRIMGFKGVGVFQSNTLVAAEAFSRGNYTNELILQQNECVFGTSMTALRMKDF